MQLRHVHCYLAIKCHFGFEFTITIEFSRKFVTLVHSRLSKNVNLTSGLVPTQLQINIHTASFLEKFIVSKSSLCSLFETNAACQLSEIDTDDVD